MVYSLELADRVRKVFKGKKGMTEKKMFGGVAFMLKGKMTVGILHDRLVARVNPKDTPKLLEKDGVWPFDFTGTPMTGYLYVGPKAHKTDGS